MLLPRHARLIRLLICLLAFVISVGGFTDSNRSKDKELSGPVPIAMEILPPGPGATVNANYSCESSLGSSECLRLTKPDAVFVKKASDRCMVQNGCFHSVFFQASPATGPKDAIVIKLTSPLEVGDEIKVEYYKRQLTSDAVAVIPPPSEVTCCLLSLNQIPGKIEARIPISARVRIDIEAPDGRAKMLPMFEHPSSSGNWVLSVSLPSGLSLSKNDVVRISADIEGVNKELVRYEVPKILNVVDGQAAAAQDSDISNVPPKADKASAAAHVCADPYLPNPPGQTDSFSVILGCLPEKPDEQLKVRIDGKLQKGVSWSLTSLSPITYSAKLSAKLQPGQVVNVLQPDKQRDPDSPSQSVAPKIKPPDTILTVQEGATNVTGYGAGLDKVRVQVVDGDEVRAQVDAPVDPTSNQFSAPFTNPLQADQQLKIFGMLKGGVSETATPLTVAPIDLDWGRVRAYFSAGLLLSNNSLLNATSANTFLDLNVDKNWLRPQTGFGAQKPKRLENVRFHTFFDARLTAIPTHSAAAASTSSAPGTQASQTPAAGSGGGSAGSTAANPTVNPPSLLNNNQAGALQIGAYLPFVLANWSFRERPYSLYVAPIAKVGFYTVTDAGTAVAFNNTDYTRNNGRFFSFYSYGVRVGHYREYKTWDGRAEHDRAPEQLSHLDIAVGRWANFAAFEPFVFTTPTAGGAPASCTAPAPQPTTAQCYFWQRFWRYSFEGVLKIPNSPLILGLSANVSAERPKSSGFIMPADDLRFLFGIRFDAAKFTGILSKLGSTQ